MSGRIETTRGDGYASCTIDSVETHNALDAGLADELAAALELLDAEESVRCVVIAGTEQVFATGGDLPGRDAASPAGGHPSAEFWTRIAKLETPSVAAVSGWALGGGCELALACDMLVVAAGTQLGQPEITLGTLPGGGATQRLTAAIGKPRTMELILTGRRFSAEQALDWGLANRLVGRHEWLTVAEELAAEVATRAPLATRLAKQAILDAERSLLAAGVERERRLFEQTLTSEDRVEAVEATIEGREPRFEGR